MRAAKSVRFKQPPRVLAGRRLSLGGHEGASPMARWSGRPLSRPMALGTHGVVSTGHALATQAGLRVLQDGGNAIDAALAASVVLTVVRPFAATIGGDLFALVHDGASGRVA